MLKFVVVVNDLVINLDIYNNKEIMAVKRLVHRKEHFFYRSLILRNINTKEIDLYDLIRIIRFIVLWKQIE